MCSPNVIYHVYNHTNNRALLFHSEENYLYFIQKLRDHLKPFASILNYCLMPTHFHLLIIPTKEGCELMDRNGSGEPQQKIKGALRTILSSYTQGINRQLNRRGSLFRAKTKFKPGYTGFLPDDWEMEEEIPFTHYIPYLKIAFHYIHQNPVRAGLVIKPEFWPYSSASDYLAGRNGTLCDFELTEKLLGISRVG